MRTQKRLQVAPSSRSLLDGSWGIFRAARGRLSYPDAVVLAWCRERRAAPLAFDRAIFPRGKRAWRVAPSTVLTPQRYRTQPETKVKIFLATPHNDEIPAG